MRKGSIVIGLLVMALCVFYVYQAQILPPSPATDDVGPGELPTWLGVAGILLSGLLVVTQFRRKDDGEEKVEFTIRGLVFLVLATAFVVAIDFVGFVAATFFFTAVGVWYLESSKRFVLPFAVAVGSAGFIYLVFQKVLDVPLPKGMLFGA